MDELVRLYQSGQKHLFLFVAHQALAHHPHAPGLAKLTLTALVEQGLGGPVRELLQVRPDLPASDPEVAVLKRRAEQLPHGRINWTDRYRTFRSNIEALADRPNVWVPDERQLLRSLSDVHLFETADGHYQIGRRPPGQLRQWWPTLTSLQDEAHVNLPEKGRLGPTAFVGVAYGTLLEQVYERTDQLLLALSYPLYVIEPDVARFAAWLHVADHGQLLRDERVFLFVGPQAPERFAQALREEPALAEPVVFINLSSNPPALEQVRRIARQVTEARAAELENLQAQLSERYGERGLAFWAERLARPGKVLGLTSRFTSVLQYSTRDALDALAEQGYHTHAIMEGKDYHQLSSIQTCRALLELDPDFVLALDHLKYEYTHFPDNLPFLTWIQDPLPKLLTPQAGPTIGPLDFVCGYYRDRCVAEFGYPAERFASVVVPVSTRVFHDGPAGDDVPEADVVFISNASQPVEQLHAQKLQRYPAGLRPLLNAIYAAVRELLAEQGYLSQRAAVQLVQARAQQAGVSLTADAIRDLATFYAYRLFDWGRRQQTLRWAASWARDTGRVLRIYGRGWEQHAALAPFAAGVLPHGEAVRAVYRRAKLALQLIPGNFKHQRTSEALLSGCLVLTRYVPENFDGLPIAEYVQRRAAGETLRGAAAHFPQLERVSFDSAAEFAGMAEYFLEHPEERTALHRQHAAVVRSTMTYAHVMRDVLARMRQAVRAQAEASACAVEEPCT